MKVSDAIIGFLESKKITDVFCISGGGCIHLIDSLRKTAKIKTTCSHHEQALLMAAEGYTKLSGQPCASVVTTGPGGTNTLTGLLGLWLDSVPSIIISGQVSSNQLSRGTGCRQIGDQEFNIIAVVTPMTKYAKMIEKPEEVLYELEKAYEIAVSGRPGPVWIDVPLDIQGSHVEKFKKYEKETRENNFSNNEENFSKFKTLLESSSRPLFVVGNGIRLAGCYSALNIFLEEMKIPVVTGPHSGVDAVDNIYEYYAGRIGILGQITSNEIVQEADLLICLGTRLPVKMTGYNTANFSPHSKKVFVDIDEYEINKHDFDVDLKFVLHLRHFFDILFQNKYKVAISPWRKFVKEKRKKQIFYYPKHKQLREYVSYYYFINQAPEYFGDIPIITSNGTAHVATLQMYQLNQHQRLFTNVGCASMGYGLPAAIGACIGSKNQKIICIEGDGSIMMNLQELQTVINHKLPIKIVLINNQGYLSIRMTQKDFFNGKEFAVGPQSGVGLPSMQKIAKAFGLPYYQIKDNNSIENVLTESIEAPGPCLIEVFTHPMERHEPKVVHKGVSEDGKIIPGDLIHMKITEGF